MDPSAEAEYAPPRRHHGCLWGCLGVLIAVLVIAGAVIGFGYWHFQKGFDSDTRIQAILDAVAHNGEATALLGQHVTVLERERQNYAYATGKGGTASYTLKVTGSAGSGELKADLDITDGKSKIITLVLIDQNGVSHYLVGAPPPNPMMQNSI